jgi:hypothetical protein
MALKNGKRILFPQNHTISESDLQTVVSHWPGAAVVPISLTAAYDRVLDRISQLTKTQHAKKILTLSDEGLVIQVQARWIFEERSPEGKPTRHICVTPIDNPDERTPDGIIRYLSRHNIILREDVTDASNNGKEDINEPSDPYVKDAVISGSNPRILVADLLERMGYAYSQRGNITFPYAGTQISAVSNIVLRGSSNPLLVDFGDFQGEAVLALAKAGFDIVQMKAEDDSQATIQKLLRALGVTFSENPTFFAIERQGDNNTSFAVPGFLIPSVKTSTVLISTTPLAGEVVELFRTQNVKTIIVDQEKPDDEFSSIS